MASAGRSSGSKKDKTGDESSKKLSALGTSLVFTGGAMIGAALLFGIKKLYDYMSETEKTSPPVSPKGSPKRSYDGSHRLQRSALSDFSGESTLSTTLPSPRSEEQISPSSDGVASVMSLGSLHEALLDYYAIYVNVPEDDLSLAKTVVEDVKESFAAMVEVLMPNHPLVALVDIGPAAEGWKVIRPDEFEVVIHLALDPQVWELVDGGQTLLAAHGYWMVKRTHLEFFSRGTKPYDRYLIGEYLSPTKVKTAFLDMTNRVSNWKTRYVIKSSVVGPAIKLTVEYGLEEQRKRLTIEFTPGVRLGDTEVISSSHLKSNVDHCYENLWLQSFGQQEIETVTSWRPPTILEKELENNTETFVKLSEIEGENSHLSECEVNSKEMEFEEIHRQTTQPELSPAEFTEHGCQLWCLKILEAVRLNHPAELGVLTPYALKTVLLHLLYTEDVWCKGQLSERFLDALKTIEDYFKTGRLPHYFCPHINLLENAHPTTLENGREFLAYVIGNNRFPSLLKTTY